MHNKILEAIQKGIKLGLEIQDDELDLSIFLKQQLTSRSYEDIKYDRDNYVDLGLPSGTIWCKYNLGAFMSTDASDWYGDYYAWGETESKESYCYNWSHYKYTGSSIDSLTKYCSNEHIGKVDNKTVLDPEDDVVRMTLGPQFKLPTIQLFKELIDHTTSEWVREYRGIDGLSGRIFIGKNGNEMFIPAAGIRGNRDNYVRTYGYLWSDTTDEHFSYDAGVLFFDSGMAIHATDCNRCVGLPVRGVLKIK